MGAKIGCLRLRNQNRRRTSTLRDANVSGNKLWSSYSTGEITSFEGHSDPASHQTLDARVTVSACKSVETDSRHMAAIQHM